jgi:hypothetical protein
MSVRNLPSVHSSKSENKPLQRTQQYLVQAKVCLKLIRELLELVKDIVVILSLIAFFVYGVVQLLQHLKV